MSGANGSSPSTANERTEPRVDVRGLRVDFVAGCLGQGGAERQLFYMATELHRAGAQVRVLSLTRGEFWEGALVDAGVPVVWVGRRSSRLLRALAVTRTVRSGRAEVVHSQHFYANVYAGLAARLLGRRGLGGIRSDGDRDLADVGGLGRRLCLRLPGLIAANSEAAIRTLQSRLDNPPRLALLPNVIDTEAFRPADVDAADTSTTPFRILFVGRLEPVKRPDRFLEVAAHLKHEQGIPVRPMVAGDGPMMESLRRQAESASLPECVFAGSVTEMAPVYRDSDALVVTSDTEGCPNAVLEAMACGLPVVAANVGGIPELLSAQTGFLVEADDVAGYSASLARIRVDASLAMQVGRRARDWIVRERSVESLVGRLAGLYEGVR